MHELSLMESLVGTISDEVGVARVVRVTLDVGKLTCVMPDALSFCFEVCSIDTPLEGARLDIHAVGGRGRCNRCGNDVELPALTTPCSCGSIDIDVTAGQELRIREVEVI